MESAYPPVVKLFSEYKGKKTQRVLDEESIGELDRVDIRTADCKIHSYSSKKFPGKVTGYLQTLFVVQEPNVIFGGKYDDWDDPNAFEDEADLLGTVDNAEDKY